ncbi:hypothetical protein EVA_07252 [gut metagenome]|uniref:Uncharacterized protein n=1 Tax=gut metagenome TaxID=749906 RepID=J9GCP3_9ZZZZ
MTGVAQTKVHNLSQICFDCRIIYRCNDFYPIIEISRHPVSRTNEALFHPSCSKNINTRMFQIAVDNTIDVHHVVHTCPERHQRTVTAHHQINGHSGCSSLIKLAHHIRVSYMIDLHTDISRFARHFILYFIIDETYEFLLHFVRRYQQFLEANGLIRFLDKIEYTINILHQIPCCSHQQDISIHPCITFMKIPRTYTSDISSLLHADMGNF